ncbi:MAG: hypothetical protein QW507_02765 [Candidatus Nanoarchaeia archaeon]|nr:hypothetical protein [Candidatus Haiyanarchaeum thermophilum]MCW1303317.1 hypothetical protein [Candidatus Haiyanarchaeum thermophilum]MCW1304101.1 hypothetical protein [Candidatus Haiyanarchaeum thermophilum]MCW1306476.1 hypothetical protein [Candidatus Haiyanarchaeum thermophilum]MCW1307227.1 hypothetical protein [Candidatus Haiyanarchaeum thermophilum]
MKELLLWIQRLRSEAEESVVLVEGEKDELALRKFGITHVLKVSNLPLFKLRVRRAIVLLDRDKEGRKKFKEIVSYLQNSGVKLDLSFYKELSRFGIRKVEELRKLGDMYGEGCAFID